MVDGIRGGNVDSPQFSRAEAVQGKIQAVMDTIQDLFSAISALLAELKAHQASKPTAPDTSGMKEGDAKNALQKFADEMGKWENELNRLNRDLVSTQHKVQGEQQKLNKLQSVDLPQAQQRDIENARKQLEQAQKQLQAQAEAFDTGATDRTESDQTAIRQAEIRVVRNKEDIVSLEIRRPHVAPTADTQAITGNRVPLAGGSGLPTGD
jgi:chromosome segregation ATPase